MVKLRKEKSTYLTARKKLLRFICLITLLVCVSSNARCEVFIIDGLCYETNGDGKSVSVRIGCDISVCPSDITIPSTVTYKQANYSVTKIENFAFTFCDALTNITIPTSVTVIGDWAFRQCSGLTSVTMPNSITEIGFCTFGACTSLISVTIPNSVTKIDTAAFAYCTALTNITIPNSVTTIGVGAFASCTGLTGTLTLPNSITEIGDSAFASCEKLEVVKIGSAIEKIGYGAFSECPHIDTLYCMAKVPPTIDSNTFSGVNKSITFYVPCGRQSNYQETDYWDEFTNIKEWCSDVDPITGESNAGIEDVADNNTLNIYPNPAKETVTIQAKGNIAIINNKGQVIKTLSNPNSLINLNISDLESGVYYIKCGNINTSSYKKGTYIYRYGNKTGKFIVQ